MSAAGLRGPVSIPVTDFSCDDFFFHFRGFYNRVVSLQNVTNANCTSKMDPSKLLKRAPGLWESKISVIRGFGQF